MPELTLAYETWGELAPDASNAILLCHALTGDSHAAGPLAPGHPTPGWWDAIVGPGKAIDTDRWFVVCVNVLGGCQGSTGPASDHPDDGKPWGSQIGRASCRERVCQSGEVPVVAVSLQKQHSTELTVKHNAAP